MTLRIHPDEILRRTESALLAAHPTWVRIRLDQVALVQNGFAFKSAFFTKNGGVPLLRIRDVGAASTDVNYAGDFDDSYLVEPGSIVVGMDGDFRVARWGGPPALLNQRVCRLAVRNRDVYDPDFLFYVLPGYLDAVNAHTSSVTVKHLSSRTVQELPLPLPPLNEQRRIVAAIEEQLSRLDASLTAARQRNAGLREAVLQAAAADYLSRPLGEVMSNMRYGTSVKCLVEAGGPPVLRIPNIRDRTIDRSELKFATVGRSELGDCFVQRGDLLVIRTNGSRDLIGRVGVIDADDEPAFASYLIRLRPDPVQVDPRFAAVALSARRQRALITERAASTAGQYNLNLAALRSLPIPLPPLEEQRRIVAEAEERLSVIDAMRASIETAHRRSAALRRAILERAFRGELVSQDPTDEPATVLLERIAAERAGAEKANGRSRRREL